MTTLRRGTEIHKAILGNATGCVVYSEHNQYKGKACSPEAAARALEKFSFAKLVECDGQYTVRVHERCWFELEHTCEEPPAATKCKRCGGPVTTAGEGNLRYTGCAVCGEEYITEDEGYNCSHCDTDNLAGATHCAHCGATRGSHPNDRTYDF